MRRARQTLGLTHEDVASQLAVSVEELAGWEDGLEEPSIERLWELSDLYRRDVDYFLVPHEGVPAALNFRLKQRHRLEEFSLNARQTIAVFDELCRSAREMESMLERDKPPPLPIAPHDQDAETLAKTERLRLEIGDKPIRDLRALLEDQGILIFHLTIPNDEFSGLSWHHPEYGPCTLINAGDNPGRRAFTTAHEYSHLLKRDGDSVCDLQIDFGVEREASRFATCFLMPAVDVIDTFEHRGLPGSIPSVEELAALASRYRVSLEAMSLRLEELNLVPKRTTVSLNLTLPPSRFFGRSRPTWRRRVGETYTATALEAYGTGRISLGKLARYFGIDIRQAMDLVEKERAQREPGGAV